MSKDLLSMSQMEVFEMLEQQGRVNGSLVRESTKYEGFKEVTPAQVYRLSMMCAKQQGINFEPEPLYFYLDNKKIKLIKATAGSGKTTISCNVIDKVIRYEGIKANEICMLSYNKESVRDLKRRMRNITAINNMVTRPYQIYVPVERVPNIRSIDSLSYNLVDQFSKELGYSKINIISALDSKLRMQRILTNFSTEHHFEVTDDLSDKLIAIYDKRNYELKEVEELTHTSLFKSIGLSAELIDDILFSYSSKLKIESYLHFSDTARIVVEYAKRDHSFREYLRKLYRVILIDEVQDITECTFQFLMFLVGTNEVPEEERNMLMVVGDDDQAIYRFKGARPHNCELLKNALPDAEIYYLSLNRRCPENILNYAKCITEQIKSRDPMPLRSNKPGGLVDSQTYVLKSDVVNELVELGKKTKKEALRNICIGYRNNVTCFALVNKFLENGIPFKIRDDYMPGSDKLSVALDSIFNLLRQPDNTDMIASHLNKITCCSKSKKFKTIAKYSKHLSDLMEECDAEYFWEIPTDKLECKDPDKLEEQFEKLEKLSKRLKRNVALDKLLPDIWELFCESYWNYMRHFYKFDGELESLIYDMYNVPKSLVKLKMEREAQKEAIKSYVEADMGIQLCTMHGLKGLEFNEVYLIELEDGVFPSLNPNEIDTKEELQEAIDDELRLFYVGVTRAKQSIHLRWSSEKPSIFKEIDQIYSERYDNSMLGALTPKEDNIANSSEMHQNDTKTFVVKRELKQTLLEIFSDENIKKTFDITLLPTVSKKVEEESAIDGAIKEVSEENLILNPEDVSLDKSLVENSGIPLANEESIETELSPEDITLDINLFGELKGEKQEEVLNSEELDSGMESDLNSLLENSDISIDTLEEVNLTDENETVTDLSELLYGVENDETIKKDEELSDITSLLEEAKEEIVGEENSSLLDKGMQTVNSMKEFTELIKRENGDLENYLAEEIELEDDNSEDEVAKDSRVGALNSEYLKEYEVDDNRNALQNTLKMIANII